MRITLLGTGTSHGVPMIACDCETCTSTDPRDRRTRTAAYVERDGKAILIDTPPELRLQCIEHGVRRVDAVIYTHAHADHIMGLDDIRRFNWLQQQSMPVYGSPATLDVIRQTFAYVFGDSAYPSHRPDIELVPIEAEATVPPLAPVQGFRVQPIPVWHGEMPVLGYRFGRFAFLTDCNRIPDESLEMLEGLDVLVLDALRRTPHPTHFSLPESIDVATRIGAARTFFTHITHELPHAATNAELPPGMALAHDGLVLEVADA